MASDAGSGVRARSTLGSAFDPRENSLNALRLVLATAVIVSHAGPLTGREEPQLGGVTLGGWAVLGFFVISGFLITRSRMRRPLGSYYRDRFLRIVPGYVVALCVTAFFFAPIGSSLNEGTTYRVTDGLSYVVHNLLLYPPYLFQESIGDTLDVGIPFPPVWNGPLWTLFYEALCYITIATIVSVLPSRALGPSLLAAAGLLTVADLAIDNGVTLPDPLMRAIPLGLAFTIGALLWLYRSRVPIGPAVAALSALALVLFGLVDQSASLSQLPYGLLLMYLGLRLPLTWVGRTRDISYGMYIYGWPVQMLLVLAAPSLSVDAPLLVDIVVVVAVTSVFALASCVAVEMPALRRKKPVPASVARARG